MDFLRKEMDMRQGIGVASVVLCAGLLFLVSSEAFAGAADDKKQETNDGSATLVLKVVK